MGNKKIICFCIGIREQKNHQTSIQKIKEDAALCYLFKAKLIFLVIKYLTQFYPVAV
jgi:hypothetical protein